MEINKDTVEYRTGYKNALKDVIDYIKANDMPRDGYIKALKQKRNKITL